MSSPASALSHETQARIAALFARVYAATDRRVAVRAAVADASFPGLVTYTGNDHTFSLHLVQRASDYGASVLADLIRGCRSYVGGDFAAEYEDLLAASVASEAARGASNAASVSSAATWQIEPALPTFVGRAPLLDAIESDLRDTRRVCLTGIAGVGKTQCARRVIERFRADAAFALELNADTADSLAQSLADAASVLTGQTFALDARDAARDAALSALQASESSCVLIDNADDPGVLRSLGLNRWRGRFVITSRDTVASAGYAHHALPLVTPTDGAAILLACARASVDDADPQKAAESLSVALDGLPIALGQAGAYIATVGGSFARYEADYRRDATRLVAKLPAGFPHDVRALLPVVEKTLTRLRETAPESAEILTWAAYLAPDAIPLHIFSCQATTERDDWRVATDELVTCARDPDTLNAAVRTLHRAGLLTGFVHGASLSLHRTTRDSVRALTANANPRPRIDAVCALVCAAYDLNALDRWDYMAAVMPHILHCVAECDKRGLATTNAARVANRAGNILRDRGEYDRAEALYARAEAIFAASEGSESKNVWAMRHNRAQTLTLAGRPTEAAALLERVLAFNEAHRGATHRDTGLTLHELGRAYRNAGDYGRAEAMYRRVLSVNEANGDSETPDYAATLNGLGLVCKHTGRRDEALAFYTQSLALQRQIVSPEHPDLAMSLYNRARFHHDAGDAATALPFYREAVEIRRKHLPATHPHRLIVEQEYSRCLRDLGLTEDDAASMAGDTSSP